jgi:hypothetical protein
MFSAADEGAAVHSDVLYEYKAMQEDESNHPCPFLFIRVKDRLWMDSRFLELKIVDPVCTLSYHQFNIIR